MLLLMNPGNRCSGVHQFTCLPVMEPTSEQVNL